MFDILKKVEGDDRLAQLFNAYLKGLSTPAIMCEPTYYTMRELRELREGTLEKKHKKMLNHSIKNFYYLTVLGNSLHQIHSHVLGAIAELEGFFAQYGDNLLDYAADKRVKSLMECGSNDDEEALTDWYRDNEADETEEWKAVRKTDPESLSHYSLHSELDWHFGGEGAGRGEYVGTSSESDFYPYTTLVENQSAFSFRKMFEGFTGKPVAVSSLQPDGTLVPMSLGDQVEQELNEDLRGERVVVGFNLSVGMCRLIRERHQQMQHDDIAGFRVQLALLRMVRDVDFPPETVAQYLNLSGE